MIVRLSNDERGRKIRELEKKCSYLEQTKQSLVEQNRYMSALHAAFVGFVSKLKIDGVLESIIRSACSLMGTEHGFIYLLEPGASEMEMRLGLGGVFDPLRGIRLMPGQGLSGMVWETAEPILIEDYKAWSSRLSHNELDVILSLRD